MKKKMIYISIIVVICLCLIISYFIYISYYKVSVSEYEISSDKINNDVNIVMIADVHDNHCKVKSKVIERIRELDPDIILCVGDIIDNQSKSDESIIDFLKSLTDITDVYFSLGNHELEYKYSDKLIEDIKSIGVIVLDKEYIDINVNENQIRLGGMYDYAFSQDDGTISKEAMYDNAAYKFLTSMEDTSSFKLMMAHRPDSFIFGEAYKWNFDLVVSGHYHGGQVILPYVGGLYAPELEWFPEVDYGHYKLKDMDMIVTRGISSSDELFPRFNNPPEIVLITLKAEEGDSYEQ